MVPGSQIEFKAVPSGNVDYRIAFDLVSVMPDFTGLQVLHVADFGAKGDGETDDMSAIHTAVQPQRMWGERLSVLRKTSTTAC